MKGVRSVFVLLCIHIFANNFKTAYAISRLPLNVSPTSYSLKIQPHIDNNTFLGDVKIFLKVHEHTSKISLHTKGLTIGGVALDLKSDEIQTKLDEDNDLLHISYSNGDCILPGEHIVFIKFSGELGTDMESNKTQSAMRKVRYNSVHKKGYVIVTDFEPNRARTVFPCFDEPHFKARFNIRLIAPNDSYDALSNMKSINTIKTPSGVIYDFQTSKVMSPYLVAFIITDYPHGEIMWDNNGVPTPIRFYSPYAHKPENNFMLEIATKCLNYFNNYTGIPYMLPKLDMIEYDRETGATENWGMVTFKSGLLCPSERKYDRFVLGIVMCHEIAHFWFGDLVTNFWWNDIWLHESFAEFFSMKAYTTSFPKSSVSAMNSYRDDIESMISADITEASYTISSQVKTEEDMSRVFGEITYMKGSAVLGMLEKVLDASTFQKGIQNYLQKASYSTATTNDLIESFEDVVSDIDVRGLLMTWLFQRGEPLISLNHDVENEKLILKQMPFPSKYAKTAHELKQKWTIPMTYYTDVDKTVKQLWFDKDVQELTIPMKNISWIKFNYDNIGLYRVNYTTELWHSLTNSLTALDESERLCLLREAQSLFTNDVISCDVLLDLFDKFEANSSRGNVVIDRTLLTMEDLLVLYDFDSLTLFVEYSLRKFTKATDNFETKVKNRLSLVKNIFKNRKPNTEEEKRAKSCSNWIQLNLVQPEVKTI